MEKFYVNAFIAGGFCGTPREVLRVLIMIDADFCHAAACNGRLSDALQNMKLSLSSTDWKNVDDAAQMITDALKKRRSFYYRTLAGRKIDMASVAFRGAIHARLLLLVSTDIPNKNWKKELENFVSDLRSDWYPHLRRQVINAYIDDYWNAYKVLTPSNIQHLNSQKNSYKSFSKKMLDILKHLQELNDNPPLQQCFNAKTPSSRWDKPTAGQAGERNNSFFSNKIYRVPLQCLIETYLENSASSKQEWNQYLYDNWKTYYPEIPLTDDMKRQINHLLALDDNSRLKRVNTNFERYFKALGFLIRTGDIQKIHQDAIIRTLVLNRTVAMVVSLLDPDKADTKQVDEVVDDIIAYLSYMNYVSNEAEDEDLIDILDAYLENGRFNRTSLQLLSNCREIWQQSYHNMKDFLDHRNKAVSVLNDKIEEMETSLAKANYNSLKHLILELDRGSFGYRLGQMYRCAMGYDTFTAEEAAMMLKVLFNQLNNMGIKPLAGESLNQTLHEEDSLYEECIPESPEKTQGPRTLLYPGWTINGSTIALPIYKIKEEK